MEKTIQNGVAAAAILSAGIGSFALGIFTVLAEMSLWAKGVMTLTVPVGPLGGKTTFAVAIWLVSWMILHLLWRNRDISRFNEVIVAALILIGFGFLGTFPTFFELFAAGH